MKRPATDYPDGLTAMISWVFSREPVRVVRIGPDISLYMSPAPAPAYAEGPDKGLSGRIRTGRLQFTRNPCLFSDLLPSGSTPYPDEITSRHHRRSL